ncbi:MAG: hypothetical protein P8X57_09485, partial [Cyclobacteriaceae bacterium]
MIVVHWTQIPTFEGSFDAFYKPAREGSRPDIAGAGALNVSAHYDHPGCYRGQILFNAISVFHVLKR